MGMERVVKSCGELWRVVESCGDSFDKKWCPTTRFAGRWTLSFIIKEKEDEVLLLFFDKKCFRETGNAGFSSVCFHREKEPRRKAPWFLFSIKNATLPAQSAGSVGFPIVDSRQLRCLEFSIKNDSV
jgi:hypothetical protein